MLPIELASINRGLKFGQKLYEDGAYTGYLNADDKNEGAGITIFFDGQRDFGEYHCDKVNGICKNVIVEEQDYWGQWKDHNREGYGTQNLFSVGLTYIGQFKNDKKHGYGHTNLLDGSYYWGQYKKGNRNGYGFYKWTNGDEYDGEWKEGYRTGVGIYKFAATG